MITRFLPLLAGEGAPAAAPAAPAAPAGGAAPPAAAPPAADTTTAAPTGPKIDAKQLAGFAADFLGKHFEGQPPVVDAPAKPVTEPKPDEGAAAAAAAAAAPAAPAKPKPKAARKPVPPKVEPRAEPAPALTADQIAQAAAKGVAEVMKPAIGATPKTELPPAEARKYATLQHMEKMYPEKYSGLADQFKTGMLELQKYADDWEKAHPGEQFDEEAEEHKSFFERHAIDWEEEDYTEAIADIRTTAALQEERKKNDARMSKLERAERLAQAAPEIGAHQTAGASVFWGNTTKELAKVIKDDGTVDTALLTEAAKKDPIGYEIRVNAANRLNVEVAELYKVMNQLAPYDEKNPVHVEIGRFAAEMELDLTRRPDDEQRDGEGRRFLPAAEYWRTPKDRREAYYWTFSPAELAALRAHSLAGRSEKDVAAEHKRQREYALAMGWTPPAGSEIVQPAAGATEDQTTAADGLKPRTPAGATDSRLSAAATGSAGTQENFLSSFAKKQMGQS